MIYRAAIEDLEIVNALFEAVMDYEDQHVKYSVFQKGIYPTKDVLKESIRDGFVFILKDENGTPCGSIVCDEQEPEEYEGLPWTEGNSLVIHLLGISPEHYGKGYGSELVRFIFQFAKEQGYVSVKLDTGGQNKPAQHLYGTKLGFRVVANKSMIVGGKIPHKDHFFYEYLV